ncbi:unnamed protein product [Linum trigynum]|uniref:CCHC-type domain-containing protein n=1 Tax=Linum trigynum TaxID=586398 RepID=A0AAV2GPI4_9ROSI
MEKQRWRRKWRSALIVTVLGRTFPYPVISRRLETLWAKCGALQISSLSFGFYDVRFSSQYDYEQAAIGGPWMIGDYYITVRPWRRNFNPKLAEVASTMVWARLPGLPSEFINKEAVERIASRIGRPVRVDRATQLGDRGCFARVCVEVELTKPLLSQYKIEGITYYIEYEGLHRICSECGMYGHMKVTCPKLFKVVEPVVEPKNMTTGEGTQRPLYGEWMTVKPKWKSSNGKQIEKGNSGRQQRSATPSEEVGQGFGSRFAALNEDEQVQMGVGMNETRVELQENVVEETPGGGQEPQPPSVATSEKQPVVSHEARPNDEVRAMERVAETRSSAETRTTDKIPHTSQSGNGPTEIQMNLKGPSSGGKGKGTKNPNNNAKLNGDTSMQHNSRKRGLGPNSTTTEGAGNLSPSGHR